MFEVGVIIIVAVLATLFYWGWQVIKAVKGWS